jgi:thioredoxin
MPIPMITEAQFEPEVLGSQLPVLVDLYADWCQPCKQLEPILEQVASELQGKLKIVRIDVDKSPNIAAAFRVQSIPMMVLIHGGRPIDQRIGLVDKASLLEMVKPVLPATSDEVKPQELNELLTRKRAVPVDVRDESSFGRHRIPGAVHVPASELPTRAAELQPSDGRIRVLYGRAGDEGKELAEKLREDGVQVAYLAGGFLHWEAEGLEVERGS